MTTFTQPMFWTAPRLAGPAHVAVKRITGPAVEPRSYTAIAQYLRLQNATEQRLVSEFITAARQKVEEDTGLLLVAQTWEYYPDAFADVMWLPFGPLLSVTSITTTSAAGVAAVLASTNYQVDPTSDPPRIVLSDAGAWPTDLRRYQPIAIRCVLGYGDDVLGAEVLGATGWTATGWTGSWAAGWTHTVGNTSVLAQSTAVVAGVTYRVTYTITGRSAGSVTVACGGQSLAGITVSGSADVTTSSTAGLTLTPESTFDGSVVLSVKPVTVPVSDAIPGPLLRGMEALISGWYANRGGAQFTPTPWVARYDTCIASYRREGVA